MWIKNWSNWKKHTALKEENTNHLNVSIFCYFMNVNADRNSSEIRAFAKKHKLESIPMVYHVCMLIGRIQTETTQFAFIVSKIGKYNVDFTHAFRFAVFNR